MREKLFSKDYVRKYSCEHKNSSRFDSYLSSYQNDMVKIIGKYRHKNHKLSPEEVISEANILLIKNKNNILNKLDEDFNEINFKKMAFAYVKNAINWSNYAEKNSKESKNLLDSVHESEDGPMTTFDLALETQGVEDELDIFKDSISCKDFLHVLTQYAYILSENEVKIISYMQKGLNQYEISEKLGITHQAISFAVVGLKEKLKSQFKFADIMSSKTPNGKRALASFFNAKVSKMSKKDKLKLINFVKSHPKSYSANQLTKLLFKSKYSRQQIITFLVKHKLYFLVNKV